MKRMQTEYILKDLPKKMVFLTGPRQVGKTYLAKSIAQQYPHAVYLNYDNLDDRAIIQTQSWLEKTDLLVLDELHKMPQWKNYLKGLYDTKPQHLQLLVTGGSARLEVFDKLGDSLAGRYFLHRLLPLSLAELKQLKLPLSIDTLLAQGGFPEPYLMQDLTEANRWRMQYNNSLLTTDIFEFENIHNIQAMRLLFELLKKRVGSPVSHQSLADDLQISPNTVKKYIEILEAMYLIFRITPYSKNIARSLLKEPKIYFFDTGLISNNEGACLENLAAVSLLKHVYAKMDYHAENLRLHYLRTKEGQEVDFVLVKDDQIQQVIEVKMADKTIHPALYHFAHKYQLPAVQIVKQLRNEQVVDQIKLLKMDRFLADLFL